MIQPGMLSRIAMLVFLGVTLAGCEVVGGIFKAGFWVGAAAVVIIVLLLVFVVAKMRR
ncbi:MAG TPA: hypothetical protein VF491_09640 [Vicinamibacterales bacterium]